MVSALVVIVLGTFALFGVAFWRVKTGSFCPRCSRPSYKCSCIEDGFVAPPTNIAEFPARRKKPFDS